MPDNLQIHKVYCEGGLNTNRDLLSQGERIPGSATRLINYEPSITGGYRRISGYTNLYPDLPGTGATIGVCVSGGIHDGIFAARKPSSGSNYLHYWDNSAEDWQAITTVGTVDLTDVTKLRFERYNWAGSRIVFVDSHNPAAVYDGTSYTQITDSNAPSSPSHVQSFKKHLFMAGSHDGGDRNMLYFSAPLDEFDFTPASGAGVINMGFGIVALKTFRDSLYVFGNNHIRKVTGNNIADFVVEEVTNDLGCIASDSVVELGGDLVFMGPDGLRPISATNKIGDVNLETVSKYIQSYFTDITANEDLDALVSVVVRSKSQFRYMFPGEESQGMLGGLRESQQTGQIGYEFSQLLGLGATCADSGYVGGYEYVIHGDEDGKVHRQEYGTSFDGNPIFSLYQTPFYHMGDPELRKNFLKLSTYLRAEGDCTLVTGIVYDYEDVEVFNPANYDITVEGAAAYYNEAVYGVGAIFDGNPSPVSKLNIAGSGTSISVKYVTNDTNASHSIQGMVLLFGINDRR
jgi:hypothetical protein